MLYNNFLYNSIYKPGLSNTIDISNPITKGLLSTFPVNNFAGNYIYDYVNYNRQGKLVNGPTWIVDNYGPAINFQGNTQFDYVIFSDNGFPSGNSPFSIIQWVKTSSTRNSFSFQIGNSASNYGQFYMGQYDIGAGLHLIAGIGGGVGTVNADAGISINDNQWHQIAAVCKGGQIDLFKDGSYINTTTTSSPLNLVLTGSGFISYFDTQNWTGSVGTTMIYGRAVSRNEIKSLNYNKSQIYNSIINKRSLTQKQLQVQNNSSYEVIIGNFPFGVGSPIYNVNIPFVR